MQPASENSPTREPPTPISSSVSDSGRGVLDDEPPPESEQTKEQKKLKRAVQVLNRFGIFTNDNWNGGEQPSLIETTVEKALFKRQAWINKGGNVQEVAQYGKWLHKFIQDTNMTHEQAVRALKSKKIRINYTDLKNVLAFTEIVDSFPVLKSLQEDGLYPPASTFLNLGLQCLRSALQTVTLRCDNQN